MSEDRVACRTPDGKSDGKRIPKWKYDTLRQAILAEANGSDLKTLSDAVKAKLSADELDRLGSFGWHFTTVRLNMEVKGELARLPGSPVRIKKA